MSCSELAVLAAVLLLALLLGLVAAVRLLRQPPQPLPPPAPPLAQRWEVSATMTRQRQLHSSGAETDHYELVGELRPPDSER